jgi:hypothetical protein
MKQFLRTPYIKNVLYILTVIAVFASCTKNVSVTPSYNKIAPDSAAGNAVLTLTGSGLSNIVSAVFDLGNVPVAFNPNFNTDGAVIFRVPAAAKVGVQHIVFTNASGYQFSVPFKVLAVPTLSSVFPAEWEAGNTVTISGNYLQTTKHVQLSGSADSAIIISATATQLVVQMPASLLTTTKLDVTNNAGTSTTTFSLINMDKELKFFTESYGPGMQDWSWDASGSSTDFAVSGTHSMKEVYAAGNGQGMSFHNDNIMTLSNYQYLSFWVKGGSADNTIKVFADAVATGPGGSTNITVPANVWTYITVPMSIFGLTTCQRFDFQISGPTTTQTLYFDNVILVN